MSHDHVWTLSKGVIHRQSKNNERFRVGIVDHEFFDGDHHFLEQRLYVSEQQNHVFLAKSGFEL